MLDPPFAIYLETTNDAIAVFGEIMAHRTNYIISILAAIALAGCSQSPGEISRDSEPFDGIAATASIATLGTEPFWGIDIEPIDDGFQARYTSPENLDGSLFSVTRFAGNNGLGFSGDLNGEAVQIALTPGQCSDAMSDRSYPYTATVTIGERTLLGCGYTSDEPFSGDESP